jgi:hypothetical protein
MIYNVINMLSIKTIVLSFSVYPITHPNIRVMEIYLCRCDGTRLSKDDTGISQHNSRCSVDLYVTFKCACISTYGTHIV